MGEQPSAPHSRIDRNWGEMLQELRVAQTGVQILTALLLTLPFSPRFDELGDRLERVYVGVLLAAVVSMLLLLTPVALHRALFHRGKRPWLVEAANLLARAGLVMLVLANVGAVWLILDVVVGPTVAWVAAAGLALATSVLWLLVPYLLLRGGPPTHGVMVPWSES